MRLRVLPCLATAAVLTVTLAGCTGTVTPPVDEARHLQELVLNGQTVGEVKGLMTARLQTKLVIYPASEIVKKESGNWHFASKSGGVPGDTDAPYLAMVITPDRSSDDYFVIIFKDGGVMAAEWFTAYYANVIHQALGVLPTAAQQ